MGHALEFWLFLWGISTADPPLSALEPFPPPLYVEQALKFNQLHESYLSCKANAPFTPQDLRAWYQDAAEATDAARLPYARLGAARDPQYDTAYRRKQLGLLRGEIGENDFNHGILPLPVPLWTCGAD